MAQCATTALAGAVPRPCVRGARGRFGGLGPVPGVVSPPFPPSRPACPALCVAGRLVWVSLTLARWYAIPRGLCVPRARSGCPSGSPRLPFVCVCARAPAASASPPPPLVGVVCAPRAVPTLGAGRAVPVSPCPSVCPTLVPCSVWRVWGGAARPRFPLTWLRVVRPPRSGSARPGRSRAGRWGEGGGWPVRRAPVCAAGGASGAGGRSASFVPLPALGRQQSGCHWWRSGHGGRGPHTAPVRARLPSLGAVRAAPWRVDAGWLVPRGSCGSWWLGRGGGPCSGPPLGRRGPAGGRGDHPLCLRGGGGRRPRGLRAGGGGGGWGGVAPRPPCSPSGGRSAVPYPAPPLVVGAFAPGVRVRSGSRGRPVHRVRPAWRGGGGEEGRPVNRLPGGPANPEPSLCPPRVGNIAGVTGDAQVRGGAAPILFWFVAVCPPRAWSARRSGALVRARSAATPAGAGGGGRWGARRAGPAAPPPPRVAVPSGGGGASPRLRGGGGSALLRPAGRGGSGGGGGGLRRPPPPRLVGCRPAILCLRCAPLGYTRAVGVAGRPWASGAARSAANGSARRGGGGREGGSDLLAHVRAPAFPRPASAGAAPFAPSWAPPFRCRSVAGKAGVCGWFTGGAWRASVLAAAAVSPPLGAALKPLCMRVGIMWQKTFSESQ